MDHWQQCIMEQWNNGTMDHFSMNPHRASHQLPSNFESSGTETGSTGE
jgi:hypothetical protein